jgi:hypothetical protein
MSEDTTALLVVQAFLDAYNARDVDEFVAQLAEDIIHEDSGGSTLKGKSEVYNHYQNLFARDTSQHSTLMGRMLLGPYVIDKEYITGRDPVPFSVIAIYKIEEGKIVSMRLLREK